MRALDNEFYMYISIKCGLGGVIEFAILSSMYLGKKSLCHHLISFAHLFHLICIFNAKPHRISLQSYQIGLCQIVHTQLCKSFNSSEKKKKEVIIILFMFLVLGIYLVVLRILKTWYIVILKVFK